MHAIVNFRHCSRNLYLPWMLFKFGYSTTKTGLKMNRAEFVYRCFDERAGSSKCHIEKSFCVRYERAGTNWRWVFLKKAKLWNKSATSAFTPNRLNPTPPTFKSISVVRSSECTLEKKELMTIDCERFWTPQGPAFFSSHFLLL